MMKNANEMDKIVEMAKTNGYMHASEIFFDANTGVFQYAHTFKKDDVERVIVISSDGKFSIN